MFFSTRVNPINLPFMGWWMGPIYFSKSAIPNKNKFSLTELRSWSLIQPMCSFPSQDNGGVNTIKPRLKEEIKLLKKTEYVTSFLQLWSCQCCSCQVSITSPNAIIIPWKYKGKLLISTHHALWKCHRRCEVRRIAGGRVQDVETETVQWSNIIRKRR